MKLLFLLLTLSFLTPVFSQKKLKQSISPATGDTMWSTTEKRLYTQAGSARSKGEILKSTVFKTGAGRFLMFSIETGRTSVFSIQVGAAARLTLSDGSVVTLEASSSSSSKPLVSYYGSFLYQSYRLNKSQIQALKEKPLQTISIQTSSDLFQYNIKSKQSELIKNQLELTD